MRTLPKPVKITPRKVNFREPTDYTCALLGSLGFSSRFISSKTKLTIHQISYRLHKAGLRRMEFRNGESPAAQIVMNNTATLVRPVLQKQLGLTDGRIPR